MGNKRLSVGICALVLATACGGSDPTAMGSDGSFSVDAGPDSGTLPDSGSTPWHYGDEGPFSVNAVTVANPGWPEAGGEALPVHVYLPEGRADSAPVLFFSHGYGATDPGLYAALIDHLVSNGFAVIYPPYPTLLSGPTLTTGQAIRYHTLWAGFEAAVGAYSDELDLTHVGFLGHSFGGGATPAMAYRGLVTNGWGSAGAFLFMMAPWYSFDLAETNVAMPDQSLAGFPEHVRSIVQVYDEDETNDHRMAIDLFEHIELPAGQSAYHNVVINPDYPTGHNVPTSSGGNGGVLDELDRLAVWIPLDALIDASFDIYDPTAGAELALTASSLPPYTTITTAPAPVQAEDFYLFAWGGVQNLRD